MVSWRGRITGLSPLKLAAGFMVVLLLLFMLYRGLWWVFGGREATKANAEKIVAEEQVNAATDAGQAATNGVIERYEYHRTVDRTVLQGQERVTNAWKGETVGNDVHDAGTAALCGVHLDFCDGDKAAKVR